MSASENAVSLEEFYSGEEVIDWKFSCQCGYEGTAKELLTEQDEDNETLYCPTCRCAAWVWD